ncbi:MAG: hypothetical protein KIS67_05320 [Verrucomicrobiae bacterium]|nr:hypothetical protein [Verrucomicrobiae bacterium]
MNLVAVLTNNGPAWVLTNRVRFEADDIGSAQKVWSADNPDGRPVANGAELTATLYYINLPTNNSDFGLKFARVLLDGEVHDQKCFWAFYPADAFNHPGPNPPPDGSQGKRPRNYFYYYMQTQAGAPTKTQHGPFYKGDAEHWGTSEFEPWPPYRYFAAYSQTSRHPQGKTFPSQG